MNIRWMSSIPDEITWDDQPDVEPEVKQQIEDAHSKLKMMIETNNRRMQELGEKGIVLDPSNEIAVRFNMLVDMFIGIISPERLHFEAEWQKCIAASLERAAADHAEMLRRENGAKLLHLPGKGAHKVLPTMEETE